MNDDTYPLAGKHVNRMGYGAMQLPGPGMFGPPRNRQHALDVLRYVVETGVNHLDTAYYYGLGVANELIHEALHPYPDDLVLVSKVGAQRDGAGGLHDAQRPEGPELPVPVPDQIPCPQPASSRSITRFLAAWATQDAVGWAVTPRILILRLACSITASTSGLRRGRRERIVLRNAGYGPHELSARTGC
jgi:Aldo/keto reductase family